MPCMAVFCSSMSSWFPGMLLTYFLNVFEIVPVAPIINGITFVVIIIIIIIIISFLPHNKEILSHARFEFPTTVFLRTQIFCNLTTCCEWLCTICGRKVL